MKLKKRFCLICIFLCGICSAQISNSTIADSLFVQGDALKAAIYYEKAAFFNDSRLEKAALLLKEAQCYKSLQNYNRAYSILKRIQTNKQDSLIYFDANYEKSLMAYLVGNHQMAKVHLQKIITDFENELKIQRLQFVNSIALQDWDKAFHVYNDYLSDQTDSLSLNFTEYFTLPKLKRRQKAELLSTFLPGVGQMYAKKTGNGIVNASLQVVFLGLGVYLVLDGFPITAIGSGGALWQAFYFGGIQNAGNFTEDYNEKVILEHQQKLIQLLE